jgi:stage II sporulation protein D
MAAVNLSLQLPSSEAPVKTLIGGKMAATANGTVAVKGENNKVTILGAGGAVRKATLVPETYTFTGKGWGHAVGMSQRGAIGMGKAGMKFDAILTHFFKGTHIETE